jgi:hypothetical protein
MLVSSCYTYCRTYIPDLNLIEEFFAELKAFVRCNWHKYAAEDFKNILEYSLDIVGARSKSAEGHS